MRSTSNLLASECAAIAPCQSRQGRRARSRTDNATHVSNGPAPWELGKLKIFAANLDCREPLILVG
jgi:hypothetical protein